MHERTFTLTSFFALFGLYGKGRKQFHLLRTIVVSVTGNLYFSSEVNYKINAHMLYKYTIFCSVYIQLVIFFHITSLKCFQLFQLYDKTDLS